MPTSSPSAGVIYSVQESLSQRGGAAVSQPAVKFTKCAEFQKKKKNKAGKKNFKGDFLFHSFQSDQCWTFDTIYAALVSHQSL